MSSRMDWNPFYYECTHSSGCHERFRSLAEFEKHWKEKHAIKNCERKKPQETKLVGVTEVDEFYALCEKVKKENITP